jgi:hypothetical protein
MFQKIRYLLFFLSVILISFGGGSCSKKVFPSGLEGNLMGYHGNFKREQKKRERVARRANRKTKRLERKANKPQLKRKKQADKIQKKLVKRHKSKQPPEVQARMKQNERETKRNYASRKSFKEKLMFWKRNKCKANGLR